MKVEWVSQENPKSAADALEKSIAKWRFFSYCTQEQFDDFSNQVDQKCSLCKQHYDLVERCGNCPFVSKRRFRANPRRHNCPGIYEKAGDVKDDVQYDEATLAQFHTVARKVAKKLRSLRK